MRPGSWSTGPRSYFLPLFTEHPANFALTEFSED
jgi:hypothetical protein